MRKEQEMFDLILGFAKADERVRAVLINGSRANPAARRDIFQDYDISYFVNETESFVRDLSWLDIFGERLIMQMPWTFSTETEKYINFLMQFMDGTRIDLSLELDAGVKPDSDGLNIVLLDKDGIFENIAPPSDSVYHINEPTAQRFFEVCNEFFWVSCYAAKGLWRNEPTYALEIRDHYMREALDEMSGWYIGITRGFEHSIGKAGKNLGFLLPREIWREYLGTYSGAETADIWQSLFKMVELFKSFARVVAENFGFTCDADKWEKVGGFLRDVEKLPQDATDIR